MISCGDNGRVRVLIAPDKFAGTLTAVEAAGAIADGWRQVAPADDLDIVPLSDGGPGFLDVLHAALGGQVVAVPVTGPLRDPATARVLRIRDAAYIETAEACGLHLVATRRDVGRATTVGVGELLAAACDGGARRCVLGLGGSATNDGGAGMLAALGAEPRDTLAAGGSALRTLRTVDVAPARRRVAGTDLLIATDVDSPLAGPYGASRVFGPQKGASPERIAELDAALTHLADLAGAEHAGEAGAGAAGGLGFGLFLLGARRRSGIETVIATVGLDDRVRGADLVLTGEGSFDRQSLRGKVPSGVARTAARYGVPCLVLAGRVDVAEQDLVGSGVQAAYSLVDATGSIAAAMSRPFGGLVALAARVARAWHKA